MTVGKITLKPHFEEWPKIARYNRDIVITEKIDGTNAAVGIALNAGIGDPIVWAQSRNRIITSDQDNFGFGRWVEDNSEALIETLGDGVHFGEWYGRKIARSYGKTDRTFTLFNTSRWTMENTAALDGLEVVPIIWHGSWEGPGMCDSAIAYSLDYLRTYGSPSVQGFMKPEGIIIFHTASNMMFKVTLEGDEKPKGLK